MKAIKKNGMNIWLMQGNEPDSHNHPLIKRGGINP